MDATPGPLAEPSGQPVAPLAGIVLVGGASRRMGRDKATLPVPGRGGHTMIEQVVSVVAARCRPVFVLAAPDQLLPQVAARVLRDPVPGAGPLPATGHGLRAAAAAGAELAFVCAVDMPLLTVTLIDALAGPAAHLGADVVLPWDGRDHYLAAIYRTGLAARVADLVAAGESSMRALVGGADTQRIVLPRSAALTNVNSPVALQALSDTTTPAQ